MTCLRKAGIMSILRKSGESGDAFAVSKQFDAFIKKALKHRIINAIRDLNRELDQFPLAPAKVIESVPAKPYESKYEKNMVLLWEEPIFISDDELAEVLGGLPERYKMILEMWCIDRRSDAEVGRLMGLDKSTVIVYRHRALRYLRDEMTRRRNDG